jgi:hypothetical protein
MLCAWLGKTSGAIRFPLIFSPFLIKQKGMASAAKERERASLIVQILNVVRSIPIRNLMRMIE